MGLSDDNNIGAEPIFKVIDESCLELIGIEACKTNQQENSIFLSKIKKIRGLTYNEKLLLNTIFGDTFNVDEVRIIIGAFIIGQYGDYGMTPKGAMFVGVNNHQSDYALATSWTSKHFFIHEMFHIWQYQHHFWVFSRGTSLALCRTFPRNIIDFGERTITGSKNATGKYSQWIDPYEYDIWETPTIHRKLFDYNLEQQAEIVADYYQFIYTGAEKPKIQNTNSRARYESLIGKAGLKVIPLQMGIQIYNAYKQKGYIS